MCRTRLLARHVQCRPAKVARGRPLPFRDGKRTERIRRFWRYGRRGGGVLGGRINRRTRFIRILNIRQRRIVRAGLQGALREEVCGVQIPTAVTTLLVGPRQHGQVPCVTGRSIRQNGLNDIIMSLRLQQRFHFRCCLRHVLSPPHWRGTLVCRPPKRAPHNARRTHPRWFDS